MVNLVLAKRFRLGRQLAKERYDQCFVLPNSLKSALILFLLGLNAVRDLLVKCVMVCLTTLLSFGQSVTTHD